MMTISPVEIDLSLDQSRLALTFTSANGKRNTVAVPINERGLASIVKILQSRHRAIEQANAPKIGTAGVPVQALVDAWIKEGNRIEDEAVREERRMRDRVGDELFEEMLALGAEAAKEFDDGD